jgi:hypothetical protein
MNFGDPRLTMLGLGLLVAAFALGAIDGIYFHLQRFRLFAHAESRSEHLIHSLRALLSLPLLWLLFLRAPSGLALHLAAALALTDQLALVADLIIERKSRASLGGLPHAEYMIHVGANALHSVGLALAFAARPAASWHSLAFVTEPSLLSSELQWAVVGFVVLGGLATAQHVYLWCRHVPEAGEPAR